jgi:Arc/MetJ family transcription regulator
VDGAEETSGATGMAGWRGMAMSFRRKALSMATVIPDAVCSECGTEKRVLPYTLMLSMMCIQKSAGGNMARTNVVLDDKLVAECQRLTKIKTRRALIDHALQELLRREQQKKILELKGRVKWQGDLKEWRKART